MDIFSKIEAGGRLVVWDYDRLLILFFNELLCKILCSYAKWKYWEKIDKFFFLETF